jgi:protein-S-isoprenylcysteine O-methyltransferase Ste14
MTAREHRDNAGVIAPPPLLLLGAFLIGLGLEFLWPLSLDFARSVRWTVGAVLIATAVLIVAAGVRQFFRAGTNLAPNRPTTSLVRSGPFAWSRNPLYLAMHFLLAGLAFVLDDGWLLLMLIPFFLVIHYGVVRREERYLEGRFGDQYRRYKASVRRWI